MKKSIAPILWALVALGAPTMAQASPALATSEVAAGGAASPSTSSEDRPHSDKTCALGEFCVGPMVTLGALDPLGVGAHVRYGRYLGAAIDYQFLPASVTISSTSANWSLLTVEGRVYPFAGSFFVAGGFGYQSFSASVHQMTAGGDVGIAGSVGIPALKLGVGFAGRNGFVLGADIGFNVPLSGVNVKFDPVTGSAATSYPMEVAKMKSDIKDSADKVVSSIPVIPQINLLRLGYLF